MSKFRIINGKFVKVEEDMAEKFAKWIQSATPAELTAAEAAGAKVLNKETLIHVVQVFIYTFVGVIAVGLPALTTLGELKSLGISAAAAGGAAVIAFIHKAIKNSGILPAGK